MGEGSKLWDDKKLLLQEDMLSPLSCAVEVARRRKMQTIQAIGLSSDQVKEVAMGMKGYLGLKELDLGGGALGHVGHSPISAVPPNLFRSAFPNLVKINLSNASPTAEQLACLFSSLSPSGKITALNLEEVDLASVAGNEFSKVAMLVELNLNNCVLNPEQINTMWDGIEEVSNLQLTKLSVKYMDLSAVAVQALAKVAARAHTLDVSNTSLTPTQANAIFTALVNNCDTKEIDFCDNSLSLVPPENIAMAVAKSRTVLLANTSLTSPQAVTC